MKKIFFFFILHFTFLSRRSNILLAVLCVGGLLFTFLPWCIPGSFLPADTHIPPGDVSGTWTIYGSPYIVDGFVTVPVDSTLIIEPSVFVIFSTNNGLQIEGRLLSEGTENDSITFTVQDSSNNTGLGFYHTDITNQDSSKITYSIFEHVSVCFDKSSNILFRKSSVSKCVGWSGVFFDENSSPRLIDITISNNTTEYYGGGLYCTDYSNPSLVNVTISGNSATCGGGISCRFNSNPTLENVNIINNSAIGAGGGIFCEESNPILNYVDIIENHVSNGIGGGIHFDENSNPEISNVNIENNSAYWGGGIGCTNSSPVLTNVIISGNSGYEGGGLFCEGYEEGSCNPILDNVAITGNEAGYLGGGIYCGFTNVNIIIVNSLITGNIAGGGGGGIGCFYESNMSLTNVTISENISSDGFGGGIYTEFECNIHLENCIMWNDIPNEVIIMTGSFVSANYCDIEGGVMGTGNIDDDPLFSDDEFHLSEYSPCIDAGNPDSLYYDIEDPYNPGYALYPAMGTIINDMGAYGGHGYYEPPVSIDNYELHPATAGYELYNYPNPFNPETTIYFETTNLHELAQIEIYNVKGQKVETLECNIRDVAKTTPQLSQRGRRSFHSITWNAKNHASGIYLYRIKANDFVSETKKMLLIK